MLSSTGTGARRAVLRYSLLSFCLLLVASCAGTGEKRFSRDNDFGYYKVGRPYKIKGKTYYPGIQENYDKTGIASWYGSDFHGKKTANGDIYDMDMMTAAHKTLPLPSLVQVTNLENNRKAVLLVNDRGPFAEGRIIDVSRRAAGELGFQKKGLARVRVQYLKSKTDDFLARMSGGKPRKEMRPLRLASFYGSEAGLHDTGTEVSEYTSSSSSSYASSRYGSVDANAPWNRPNRANPARRGVHRASPDAAARKNNLPLSAETVAHYPAPVIRYDVDADSRIIASPANAAAAGYAAPAPVYADDGRYNPPARTGDYFVQAATYSVPANAAKAEHHLSRLGEVRVKRVTDRGTVKRKVFVGPAYTESEAQGLLRDVIAHGYDTAKIVPAYETAGY